MTEIEKQELQLEYNSEYSKTKSPIEYKKYTKSDEPLTDDEFHRLFRNEFLTIDDPQYFIRK